MKLTSWAALKFWLLLSGNRQCCGRLFVSVIVFIKQNVSSLGPVMGKKTLEPEKKTWLGNWPSVYLLAFLPHGYGFHWGGKPTDNFTDSVVRLYILEFCWAFMHLIKSSYSIRSPFSWNDSRLVFWFYCYILLSFLHSLVKIAPFLEREVVLIVEKWFWKSMFSVLSDIDDLGQFSALISNTNDNLWMRLNH